MAQNCEAILCVIIFASLLLISPLLQSEPDAELEHRCSAQKPVLIENDFSVLQSRTLSGVGTVIWNDSFETDRGWTGYGGPAEWERGQPRGSGGDPASAFDGINVLGNDLSGNGQYENNVPACYITSPIIDCTGYRNVGLRFQRWLGIESSSYDHADVAVSNDGSTWTTVWVHSGSTLRDNTWIECDYDISSVADNRPTVRIRFGLGPTDYSITYCGWNIDNVTLYTPDAIPPTTTSSLSGLLGNNGWYRSAVEITLDATDNPGGAGVNYTKYRIDGGSWKTYTGPFMLLDNGTYNVTYYSVDFNGNMERENTTTVKIDYQNPTTEYTLTPSSPGSSGWYEQPVTLTFSAADNNSGVNKTYYRVDRGSWTEGTTFVLTLNGIHTIDYYTEDIAGNREPYKTVTPPIKIDTQPPRTTHTLAGTLGNNSWYRSSVRVTLSTTDDGAGGERIMYRIDSGTEQQYSSPFTVSGDGNHTVQYYAIDLLGHAESPHPLVLKIDCTSPNTTALPARPPNNNGWYNATVIVMLSASDATSGIEKICYRVDRPGWSSHTGTSKEVQISADGHHTLYFYSVDVAGNAESAQALTINIDTIAPRIWLNVTGMLNNSWYVTVPQLTLSAGDTLSGIEYIEYRVDSGEWVRFTESTRTFEIATDGSHTVEYCAVDKAGNRNTNIQRIQVDLTPPSTQLLPDTGGKWLNKSVLFTLFASDGNGSGNVVIHYRIGAGGWRTYTGAFRVADKDGVYQITYYGVDAAGNIESPPKTLNIRIDTAAPKIEHTPAKDWFAKKALTLNAKVTDATSGVLHVILHYQTGDGVWKNLSMTKEGNDSYSAVIPAEDITTGGLEYYISATDIAGNTAIVSEGGTATTPYRVKIREEQFWLYALVAITVIAILLLVLWFVIFRYRAKRREEVPYVPPPSPFAPPVSVKSIDALREKTVYVVEPKPPAAPQLTFEPVTAPKEEEWIVKLKELIIQRDKGLIALEDYERERKKLLEGRVQLEIERAEEPEGAAEKYDPHAEIKKYEELKDKGLITEKEFEEIKSRLLAEKK